MPDYRVPPHRNGQTGDGVSPIPPGLGNPHEDEYFFMGYRDWGQGEPGQVARPIEPITRPRPECSPEKNAELDCTFQRLQDFFQRTVVFSKRPANVEPPWVSRPIIKAKSGLTVAAGAIATLFDRKVPDKYRAMVSMVGIEVGPVAPVLNGQVEFWFALNNATTQVLPIFDDQTPTAYGATTPLIAGHTTVMPGSVENPYSLLRDGLAFRVIGASELLLMVQNKSGVPITLRGVMGMYQYWLSPGATEFESADVQL